MSCDLPNALIKFFTLVVSGNESQDVLVSEHDGLIDLCLAEPRALLPRREDLDRHVLATPLPPPHLAEAALPDALLQHDGPGDGPLDEQWESWRTPRTTYGQNVNQEQRTVEKPMSYFILYHLIYLSLDSPIVA